MITFEDVKNNEEINAYIRAADKVMDAIGYTEHSFAHVTRAAEQAADILDTLGYSERTRELAQNRRLSCTTSATPSTATSTRSPAR